MRRIVSGDPMEVSAEWSRLGLPYESALALMQVRGTDAGAALARAVTILDEIEARPAAALARKLAKRIGAASQLPKQRRGPYTVARQHPLGLTRQEQQVLTLIAEGLGNKEAARRLSRSPRTVEHQVSAVLGKFNAANRMEILLRLRGEPWLLPPEGALRASENRANSRKLGKFAKIRKSVVRKLGGRTDVRARRCAQDELESLERTAKQFMSSPIREEQQ